MYLGMRMQQEGPQKDVSPMLHPNPRLQGDLSQWVSHRRMMRPLLPGGPPSPASQYGAPICTPLISHMVTPHLLDPIRLDPLEQMSPPCLVSDTVLPGTPVPLQAQRQDLGLLNLELSQ